MAQKNQRTAYCHSCGVELTRENCREVPKEFSQSGLSAYCIECEQKILDRLAQTEGRPIALFHTCACLDVPCNPLLLDGINIDTCEDIWITYINALAEAKQDKKRNKVLGFADGAVTALQELFGRTLDHKDFVAYIDNERKKIAKLVGTEQQREKWGTQPLYKGLALTREMYDELDRLYEIRENSYKGQTITPQMEDTLIKVAKSNVIYDHLMRQGLVKMALDVQKNIDLLLASEQMRKKDEKPTEQFRMDALVDALEKAGCMENGDFLNYDELVEVLRDNFIKSKKYDYSLDVADQVVLDVINAMRGNAELLPLTELPFELAVEDEYGEFEDEETEEEKKRKEFAGLTKVQFTNENNDAKNN